MLIGLYKFLQAFVKWNFFGYGTNRTGFMKIWALEFEKISACPNEAVNEDCVVVFTGGYEKLVSM